MIADLVRKLGAAGCTIEQIAVAVDSLEQKDADRRTRNRDRMRSVRARACTDEHVHAQDSALSSLLPSESQKPKEEKKERAKRDRGHVCPDDLRPSESHFEAGQRKNISRPRVEACCEAMKSWSKSNSHRAVARKVDWSAALFGWIDRESERTGKVNGHRTIMAAADDLIERVRGFDAPAPSGLRDGTRAADARLLPKG